LSSEMFISLNLARPDEQIFKGLSLCGEGYSRC
jgi:hypothetical protein